MVVFRDPLQDLDKFRLFYRYFECQCNDYHSLFEVCESLEFYGQSCVEVARNRWLYHKDESIEHKDTVYNAPQYQEKWPKCEI